MRSTYCGVCFDSFENFSLPLQDFMAKHSLKSLSTLPLESDSHDSNPVVPELKLLLNSLLSAQIPEKRLILCRDCGQTIHFACLPNKSYKRPTQTVFFEGVEPVGTFLCCVCQMNSQNLQVKDKKSKVSRACIECMQATGFRVALQGKKRDVLLSQFVHPVCALFSSVIAPKHLDELSFFRWVLCTG